MKGDLLVVRSWNLINFLFSLFREADEKQGVDPAGPGTGDLQEHPAICRHLPHLPARVPAVLPEMLLTQKRQKQLQ